jgi:hypothetical protein
MYEAKWLTEAALLASSGFSPNGDWIEDATMRECDVDYD